MKGFPLDVARKLREMVTAAQGRGPVMQAKMQGVGSREQGVGVTVPSHELVRGCG